MAFRARRRSRFICILLVALGGTLDAQATRSPLAPPSSLAVTHVRLDTAAVLASARPDIDAANSAWVPGLRSRNAAAIVAAYADSGIFVSPDGVVTRGRSAIANMYASRFPGMREIIDGGVIQDGTSVAGPDLIYEWGRAWLRMSAAAPGAPPVRSIGGYLTVWARGADAHWHITRNLAFAAPAPAPARP